MLGGLKPKQVIAIGESQSAGRLVTYIDAVHPLVNVYDGFLVHSRMGGGRRVAGAAAERGFRRGAHPRRRRRARPRVPNRDRRFLQQPERPPAGHQHVPAVGGGGNRALRLLRAQHRSGRHRRRSECRPRSSRRCRTPPTSRTRTSPATRRSTPGRRTYVLDAAFDRLNRWVAKGIVPPIAPRLQTTGVGPVVFATDANGNVLGGIRTPAVDAPVAMLSGAAREALRSASSSARRLRSPPPSWQCSTPPTARSCPPGPERRSRHARRGSSSTPTPRAHRRRGPLRHREPVAVAHRQQLEQLAVGVADHHGKTADVRVLEHAAAVLHRLHRRRVDVVDRHGDVGEPDLVHHPRVRGACAPASV